MKILINYALISVIVLLAGCYVNAEIDQKKSAPSLEQNVQTASNASIDKWKKDCVKTYTSTCLKLDIVSLVDRLSEQENLGEFGSINY